MNLVIDRYHYKIKHTDADDSIIHTATECLAHHGKSFVADSLLSRLEAQQIQGIKDDLCNYSKSQEARRSQHPV